MANRTTSVLIVTACLLLSQSEYLRAHTPLSLSICHLGSSWKSFGLSLAHFSHDLCVVHLMHSSSDLWVRFIGVLFMSKSFSLNQKTSNQRVNIATHSLISSTYRHSSTLFLILFTIALTACLSSVTPIILTNTKPNYTRHSTSSNALWHHPRSADGELLALPSALSISTDVRPCIFGA